MPWYGGGDRSRQRSRLPASPPFRAARGPAAPLALDQRTIFADEELEVRAFFVGELQEDLLALGVFELVAVSLEEAMRAALALDPEHKGLAVVHPVRQTSGARREEPLRSP